MSRQITYRSDRDIPVESWIALFEAVGYNRRWGERNARASLDHCYLTATAWDGERAVGTLSVRSDKVNFAIIDDLVVHPDYRGRGIGTALMRSALDGIAALKVEHVQLYPIPGRESFFARFGFRVQPDATVMDWFA